MREALDNAIADRRFILSHVVGFAALALLLAAVGVYAVTSHVVRRRGRELSIRAALGARRGSPDLASACATESWWRASGVFFGALLSIALTPQLRGFLYEVNPWDWSTLLSVAVLLVPAVMCASYFPGAPGRAGRSLDGAEIDLNSPAIGIIGLAGSYTSTTRDRDEGRRHNRVLKRPTLPFLPFLLLKKTPCLRLFVFSLSLFFWLSRIALVRARVIWIPYTIRPGALLPPSV